MSSFLNKFNNEHIHKKYHNISNKISKNLNNIYNYTTPEYHKDNMNHHLVCGLFISGKLVSVGFNSSRNYSHDKWLTGHSCHAEIDALRKFHNTYSTKFNHRKIQSLYSKMSIYVVRYNKCINVHSTSAPCINCAHKIKELGIKNIIYCDEFNNYQIKKTCEYNTNHISSSNRMLLKNLYK